MCHDFTQLLTVDWKSAMKLIDLTLNENNIVFVERTWQNEQSSMTETTLTLRTLFNLCLLTIICNMRQKFYSKSFAVIEKYVYNLLLYFDVFRKFGRQNVQNKA